jgi:hypothetical protein
MKRTFAAAIYFALLTVTPAHAATLTWDVNATALSGLPGMPPQNTWTVTGSFVFDPSLQTITDFNISAAGFPTTTAFTLNASNAQASFGNNLIFDNTNVEFQNSALPETVFLQTALANLGQPNPSGYPLDMFSSVAFDNSSRFFLQGEIVSAVPLPATLPLFGSALAGLGGAGWLKRRRKVS